MLITKDDLLKEISLEGLTQLSDLNGVGAIDEQVIEESITESISFIESFIVLPKTPTPLLRKIAVELTVFELKRRNELILDKDIDRRKEIEGYLSKMSKGSMPTTVEQTKTETKRDRSYAFKISKRILLRRGF